MVLAIMLYGSGLRINTQEVVGSNPTGTTGIIKRKEMP